MLRYDFHLFFGDIRASILSQYNSYRASKKQVNSAANIDENVLTIVGENISGSENISEGRESSNNFVNLSDMPRIPVLFHIYKIQF